MLTSQTLDHQKENRKIQYRITLNGKKAIQWMLTLYTLMGQRRKAKIEEVLLKWKEKDGNNSKDGGRVASK
jgi:hypothetical protein